METVAAGRAVHVVDSVSIGPELLVMHAVIQFKLRKTVDFGQKMDGGEQAVSHGNPRSIKPGSRPRHLEDRLFWSGFLIPSGGLDAAGPAVRRPVLDPPLYDASYLLE